jgi:hypothetical protein
MTKFYIAASIAILMISSSAFAAGKGQESAEQRLKVAACKDDAKANGIKTSSPDFYSHMASCLDRTTVAVNVAPEK